MKRLFAFVMSKSTRGPSVQRVAPHPATFERTTVYFIWTQATKRPLVLGKATHRLLRAEIASTAAWPSEQTVRLPPSLARVDAGIARLRAASDFVDEIDGWRSLVGSALRHPRMLARVLRLAAQGRKRTPDEAEDEDSADPLDEVEMMLMDWQKVALLEREIDRSTFGGDAHLEDRFVRLMLRPTHHTLTVAGEAYDTVFEPRLLLHEEGVIQIAVGVELPAQSLLSGVVAGSSPESPIMSKSRIPEPFAPPHGKWAGGSWSDTLVSGVRERILPHDEPADVGSYLEFLAGSVQDHIHAELDPHSLCFPVVITQPAVCCSDWSTGHPRELLALTSGVSAETSDQDLRAELPRDFAAFRDHSMFHSLASATVVHWDEWRPGIWDLNFTMLYEHATLLYARARRAERKTRLVPSKRRQISGLSQVALFMDAEARGAFVHAGTARTTFRDVLRELGVPEILDTLAKGLALANDRATARASERVARSTRNLTLFGLGIAVVAAIPATPQILSLIESQRAAHPDESWWASVQVLASSPLQLSALVLLAIAVYGLGWAGRIAFLVGRALWRFRKRGYESQLQNYSVSVGSADETPR